MTEGGLSRFSEHIDWYVTHVGSLHRMVPLFAHTAGSMTKRIVGDLDKFIADHAVDRSYSAEGRLETYTVPIDFLRRHKKLHSAFQDSRIFTTLFTRMALVTLVSVYDAYLGRLARTMFESRPELLKKSERQYTFAQLSEFADLTEAREHLLEAEVESLLRESHSSQFEWLENKLNMKLRKDLDIWPHFIEVTERRNLFVHCDGIVSRQYLTVCQRAGCAPNSLPLLGEKLLVSPDYFEKACYATLEIGVKLGQTLWRKLIPTECNAADISLISTTYELLVTRDYKIAEILAKFGTQPPVKQASADAALTLKINLAIAFKGQNRQQEVEELLQVIDLSASAYKFQLAAAVLRDQWQEAADIMRRIGPDGEIAKTKYEDWPLFQWFQKTRQFKEAYLDIFKEPFKHVQSREQNEQSFQGEKSMAVSQDLHDHIDNDSSMEMVGRERRAE